MDEYNVQPDPSTPTRNFDQLGHRSVQFRPQNLETTNIVAALAAVLSRRQLCSRADIGSSDAYIAANSSEASSRVRRANVTLATS
jgi:hypothetical protein